MSSGVMPGLAHAESRGSQLDQVSIGNSDGIGANAEVIGGANKVGVGGHGRFEDSKPVGVESFSTSLVCSLGVHEEAFSKEDALLDVSLFPQGTVRVGDHIRIVACETGSPFHGIRRHEIGQQDATHRRRLGGLIRYVDTHGFDG